MGSFDDFLTWQFWVVCLFIQGIIQAVKNVAGNVSPLTISKGWWKAFLTLLNPAWGLIAAIPPGFLMGASFGERSMVGVVAGLISQYVYALVIKKVADRFGLNPPDPDVAPVPKPETASSARKTPLEPRRALPPDEQSGGP